MFGVPVRIHPFFWLVTAILGWQGAAGRLDLLLVWIACVLGSILLHEFGHVFAGRLFGAHSHVVLYSFGGLAVGSSDLPGRWQRVVVYAAGPLVQLAFYFLLRVLVRQYAATVLRSELAVQAIVDLIFINFYWAVLNLLPIWPLDGGQMSREILQALMPRKGFLASLVLSVVAASGFAVYFYTREQQYNALLFALLAFGSFQAVQQVREQPPWSGGSSWERDPDYWRR